MGIRIIEGEPSGHCLRRHAIRLIFGAQAWLVYALAMDRR